ncbi:hypothetical protein B0O99DRAFT_362433 [Bisporella sp. PMI_857]|nr:hypothetical protein B0O99DRAFT_362433 [Bisporella sp. PMI_857]
MEQLNPIACELCRTKKSKCDRQLPACTPCRSSGAMCHYPPSNKRGIPSGYIYALEQRLLETETALFDALSASSLSLQNDSGTRIKSNSYDCFSEHSTAQSKEAKMEEWERLPLMFADQRQNWLREKLHTAKRRQQSPDSMDRVSGSQEPEDRWLGSSQFQGIRQNASPVLPRKRRFRHHDSQDPQQVALSDYSTRMSKEGISVDGEPSELPLQAPEIFPDGKVLASPTVVQQAYESTPDSIVTLDRAHSTNTIVDNSSPLTSQPLSTRLNRREQPTTSADMVLSSPTGERQSSMSNSSAQQQQQLENRQLSSKLWRNYF